MNLHEDEKKEKKYDKANLIKVEGQGKTKESICMTYIEMINVRVISNK